MEPAAPKRKKVCAISDLCMLCGQVCDEDKSNITDEAWNKIKTYAEQWVGLDTFEKVFASVNWENQPESVYFHKMCRLNISSQRKLQQALRRKHKTDKAIIDCESSIVKEDIPNTVKENIPRKSTRSKTGPVHDKNLCIWCMKPGDTKHPNQYQLCLLQTSDGWQSFKKHINNLEDEEMKQRLSVFISSVAIDPTKVFAIELRYHQECWLKYVYDYRYEPSDTSPCDEQFLEAKTIFLRHVESVVFEEGELRTLKGLLEDFCNVLKNFGIDSSCKRTSTVKEMLQEKFGDRIGFHTRYRKNESTLVYDTSGGGGYIEAAINSWGITTEQLLKNVAGRLKEELHSPGITWPPHIEELEEFSEENDLLKKFLIWLKFPPRSNYEDNILDPSVQAIASILLSYITGKRGSFQTKLSVTLHGLTRSREIVDILNKFSLGISYYDVHTLYSAWTKNELEKNSICPGELASGMPGVAIMDNDDFCDDTLTGENTSHRTNVMFVQAESLENMNNSTSQQVESLSRASDVELRSMCLMQHQIEPYKTKKRGVPAVRCPVEIENADTQLQAKRGTVHALLRLSDDILNTTVTTQMIPAFIGFQSQVQPEVNKSKAYYFLTFPKPPNKSVVHEVMCRMTQAAKHKDMPFLLLVGDQPVYALMVQLRAENPVTFSAIIPFLGPFHTHCSFMSAIYKRFCGSGLSDVLVAGGVIAEGSVQQALCGKHYKRGLRCYLLMYEALARRAIQKASYDGIKLSDGIKAKLSKLRDQPPADNGYAEIYDELESSEELEQFVIQVYCNIESSGSSMAKYWMSFMQMVEVLMMNVHSLRTQNFEDFKASLQLMLPWLQIYDKDKYGRWLVEFWLELCSLPGEKSVYFKDGLFSQSITGKPYSCIPLDMWIEMTMNKGSKMKAGWIRILKNEKMLLTSTRNVNAINRIRTSLHTLANFSRCTEEHKETSKRRIAIDEHALQGIDSCFTEFDCDPFDLDKPQLRALQSGLVASGELVYDFETAHTDGKAKVNCFLQERMYSNQTLFNATVRRSSRCNFSNPPKVKTPTTTQFRTEEMENQAMCAVINLAEKDSDFELTKVMEYRLTGECLSIFNTNRTMKKTQKSQLVEKFSLIPIDKKEHPKEYIALIDVGFLWHIATPTAEDREKSDGSYFSWSDYAKKIFRIADSRHDKAVKIIFVNDPYFESGMKDCEHTRRADGNGNAKNVFIKSTDKCPTGRSFQEFFHNNKNKKRLQQFLKNEFKSLIKGSDKEYIYCVGSDSSSLNTGCKVTEFECAHEEADTVLLYIYAQLQQKGNTLPIIIDAEDTDVLVLACYASHEIDGTLLLKRKQHLYNCTDMCSKEITRILVPLYVLTGTDVTSGFFAHGKKTIYDRVACSDTAKALLLGLGQELIVSKAVISEVVEFTMRYIYNDTKSKTLGEARSSKWLQMKRKHTARLPPDLDSMTQHIKRVNYVTFIYLHFAFPNFPSPLGHGWFKEGDKCLPVRFTQEALPKSLQENSLSLLDNSSPDSLITCESASVLSDEELSSSDSEFDTDSE